MKKIILLVISFLVFISCGTENDHCQCPDKNSTSQEWIEFEKCLLENQEQEYGNVIVHIEWNISDEK